MAKKQDLPRLRGFNALTQQDDSKVKAKSPRRPILIALDFDRTFTADRSLWKAFIVGAVRVGHRVICVTTAQDNGKQRSLLQQSFAEVHPLLHAILFTGGQPKRKFALLMGHRVDIWIDDVPEVVGAFSHHEVRELEGRFPTDEPLPVID
jgi:hypothetical protein